MKIAIIGGTGLIGSQLASRLRSENHSPILLSRTAAQCAQRPFSIPVRKWDPSNPVLCRQALDSVDAIVNLAGEPIDSGRWTTSRKNRILHSRVQGIKSILEAVSELESRPKILISGSAVGIYGSRGDEVLGEGASLGNDFLAQVCIDCEQEANKAKELNLRVINIRTGVVLSPTGGALRKMLVPFKLGVGGRIGDGKQWFPWIHEFDIASLILHCIHTDSISGPVNATSPGIVTNLDFTRALGKVLRRPTLFPVPLVALRVLFGEMSSIMFSSHHISSEKIEDSGFSFRYREVEDALRACMLSEET